MPKLTRRMAIKAMRLLFAPPDPSRRVRHAERVQLAGREWVSVHTPGHTIDHLCLYDPEHGLLLSGDHVLPVDHARTSRAWATVPMRCTATSRRSTSSPRSTA